MPSPTPISTLPTVSCAVCIADADSTMPTRKATQPAQMLLRRPNAHDTHAASMAPSMVLAPLNAENQLISPDVCMLAHHHRRLARSASGSCRHSSFAAAVRRCRQRAHDQRRCEASVCLLGHGPQHAVTRDGAWECACCACKGVCSCMGARMPCLQAPDTPRWRGRNGS